MTTGPGHSYEDLYGSRTLMCTPVRYIQYPHYSISLRGVLHRGAVSTIFKVFGMTMTQPRLD